MRRVWLIVSMLAASLTGNAVAQSMGKQPARIVLAFEGGAARPIAQKLAERTSMLLGRTVFVEEKPGASGRIAALALKKAAPDGTTLSMLPIAVPVFAPIMFKDFRFDPVNDFAPVTQIATYTLAFAVPYDHPARSIPEFVAWVKAHPAQAFYGTPAAGSLAHFLGVLVVKATGVPMDHVAYKGSGPMSLDLVGGTIPAGISVVADLIELHRAGKMRILATSGARRLVQLPDVPTFIEQGYPAIEASGWVGIFAPAKTPKAVVDQWSAAMVTAVHSPEMRDMLASLGVEPTGTTPAEFAAIVAADIARWAPIVAASGFRAE